MEQANYEKVEVFAYRQVFQMDDSTQAVPVILHSLSIYYMVHNHLISDILKIKNNLTSNLTNKLGKLNFTKKLTSLLQHTPVFT